MAGRSEYIEEAYRELERMSADERARLEYEARQKAIRDHEAIMSSAWNRGAAGGKRSCASPVSRRRKWKRPATCRPGRG